MLAETKSSKSQWLVQIGDYYTLSYYSLSGLHINDISEHLTGTFPSRLRRMRVAFH